MPFDGITVNAVKQELETLLEGSRVDRVFQPEKETIIIRFRSRKGNYNLLLSCRADAARVHLIDVKPENPPQPPVFCMVLRKHLENGTLTDVNQPGLERILTLRFESINDAGTLRHLALHCEIMGKHSNMTLVDEDTGIILDGAKRFTSEFNRYREILPGIPYVLPPKQNKQSLLHMSDEEFRERILSFPLGKKLRNILLDIMEGFSPLLCQEVVFRAGLAQDTILDACGEYELTRLWRELVEIKEGLAAGSFCPTLVRQNSAFIEYYPFDLLQFDSNTKEHFRTVNDALLLFFQTKETLRRINNLRHKLERIVNSQIKKAANKLALLEQELEEAGSAEEDRVAGELITANIHRLSRGERVLEATNFYDPEQKEIRISLDPSLTPSQNAQRYFKRYRKAAVKIQKAAEYIAETRKDLDYLDSISLAVIQADSLRELEEIREELVQQGFIRPDHKKKPALSKAPGFLTYRSSDDFLIFVGKNNRQNDFLTLKVAKHEDMWFHAKDMPGAHVIVKAEGKTIPETTLAEAAMLAAYYSRGKLSGNVPVDYTRKEHVRKPKGAKPGFVIYDHHSTIYVTPLEEKVQKLVFDKAD